MLGEEVDRMLQVQDMVPTDAVSAIAGHGHFQLLNHVCSLFSFVSAYRACVCPAILIPACASSSPVFLMMYSAYKLNNMGDNIQPLQILIITHYLHSSISLLSGQK